MQEFEIYIELVVSELRSNVNNPDFEMDDAIRKTMLIAGEWWEDKIKKLT